MARRAVGVDLGTYSVKLLRLEASKQNYGFEVLDCIEEVLKPVEDTKNGSPKELLRLQQQSALKALKEKGLLDAEIMASGISSLEAQVRHMEVPFKDQRKIESILPGVLESELPFDLNEKHIVWNHDTSQAESDEEALFPINVVLGNKEEIQGQLELMQTCGFDPRILHVSSLGLYEIVREIGVDNFHYDTSLMEKNANLKDPVFCIVDVGHSSTNLCFFNKRGIVFSKALYRGSKEITEKISEHFGVSFEEASELKHQYAQLTDFEETSDEEKIVRGFCQDFFEQIIDEFLRASILVQNQFQSSVLGLTLAGGGSRVLGIEDFFNKNLLSHGKKVMELASNYPKEVTPNFACALAYAFSCIHLHAKDNRYNLRVKEFVWRGGFEVVKAKTLPLTLWGVGIVCSLFLLYFSKSLILEKEIVSLEGQISEKCFAILGEKRVNARKCLTKMNEEINKKRDMGVPDKTASDFYVKISEVIPKNIEVKLNEMEITDKRAKIGGLTDSYKTIDKLVSALGQISCFKKIEKTKAVQEKDNIRFQITSDIKCKS